MTSFCSICGKETDPENLKPVEGFSNNRLLVCKNGCDSDV